MLSLTTVAIMGVGNLGHEKSAGAEVAKVSFMEKVRMKEE